jgi:hypothetical protein
MHVTVELHDGTTQRLPRTDWEADSLAAFLIIVDIVTETNITRRSMPKLLHDPAEWSLHLGAGGILPRSDDPEVHEAIRALAQWAATQQAANPLVAFQHFAFESPATDEGLEVIQRSAWQESDVVASACWSLREAIHGKPGLQVLDRKFPLLASPAASPDAPKSNLDALREIAFGASGRLLRLLLTT